MVGNSFEGWVRRGSGQFEAHSGEAGPRSLQAWIFDVKLLSLCCWGPVPHSLPFHGQTGASELAPFAGGQPKCWGQDRGQRGHGGQSVIS